jgi:hypothetical protein
MRARVLTTLLSAGILASLVAAGPAGQPPAESGQNPRTEPPHVVMISVDGLMPSVYTRPGPSKVPTLRRLMQRGVWAEGVIGVLPSVTYPSHTTMITGVLPAVHGIYNNRILDPEGRSGAAWYWYARDIRVATLPGAVKSRGLTTAAVSWPATVGSDIDFLMPEYGRPFYPETLQLLRALSHPRGLLDTFEAATGRLLSWPLTDADRTGLAAWIIRTYRPHLMLLHIFEADSAQHRFGPGSPEALGAIEESDAYVETILDALADAGLSDRTNVVIVSDHGFLPIGQQLQPNAMFRQEGLLEVGAQGQVVRWDAYFHAAGGAGFVMLRDPTDRALHQRVERILTALAADPAHGILRILREQDLRWMGADPRASFALDMQAGFYTGSDHDVLLRASSSKGGHGFDPTRPELYASLVMAGPDVPQAGSLGVVRMSQVAPTIAAWFDVGLSQRADAPLALTTRTEEPGAGPRSRE